MPVVTDEMLSLSHALKAVLHGRRITKLEWGDNLYWGELVNEQLCLHKPDGVFYPWILSTGDLTGTDWIILED